MLQTQRTVCKEHDECEALWARSRPCPAARQALLSIYPCVHFGGGGGLVTAEVVSTAVSGFGRVLSREAGRAGRPRGRFPRPGPYWFCPPLHPGGGGGREGSGTSAPCSAALAPRPSPRPRPCPFGLLRAHCARAPPGPALSGHGAAGTGKPRLDGSETGDPRVAAVRSPGHSGGPLGCGEALPSGARVPM